MRYQCVSLPWLDFAEGWGNVFPREEIIPCSIFPQGGAIAVAPELSMNPHRTENERTHAEEHEDWKRRYDALYVPD